MINLVVKKNRETEIEDFLKKNSKKYSIPKVALKALTDFGIFDARVLSVLTESEIAAIPNVSEKTALALVRAADDNFRGPLFQKAADQSERFLKKRKYFTTGSDNLNELLGGGMPTSTIVEINGEYRTGKTQTCLTCAVTAQLSEEQGGLGRPVIYVDTENSFQANHLIEIGNRFGFSKNELLDNIFVVQAEQLRYLDQAMERLPGYVQALDPGLIVIDSLMAPFRNEFHELNLLAVRQKKIGKLIGLLKRIAIAFNTCVIFTNQVMANIGFSGQYIPVKATGGHVVAHASDIRIFMKKSKGNSRKAKIDDCAWLPNEDTIFYITTAGISDTETLPEPDDDGKEVTKKKSKSKVKNKDENEEEDEEEELEQDDEQEIQPKSPMLEGINEANKHKASKESKEPKQEDKKLEKEEQENEKTQEKEEKSSKKSSSKKPSKTTTKKSKVPA